MLEAQVKVRKNAPEDMKDITLITQEELSEIRRIWLEEKHEFDDSLPRIYEEVTGEPFMDSRPGVGHSLLGSDEWDILSDLCGNDTSQEDAIDNAHLKRNLKNAVLEGDINQVKEELKKTLNPPDEPQNKQLSWGKIKFGNNADT